MKKIIIEDVKVGVSKGGMACGPVSGHVVAEARIRKAGNKISYYGLVEVGGTADFYESPESQYDIEINEEYSDDYEFPAAEGFGDYNEFFEEYDDMMKEDKAHALLLKYLVSLVRLDWDDVETLKADSVGKTVGSFEIPVCDVEEEYLEGLEADEEFDPHEPKEIFALETSQEGCSTVQPFPCKEAAFVCVDMRWNKMSQEERNAFEVFRIIRTTQYWSEVVGPVYNEAEEVLKDYKE